jgi:hypothetical protein
MNDLLEAAILGVNIIPTSLLIFILVYWLIVMMGLIDMHAIDISPDHDFHMDVHTDVDTDVAAKEIHTGLHGYDAGSVSWINSVLVFFNLGQVPFMVFMSFFILPVWVISILSNHYLGNSSFLMGILLLIPNLIVSLFIAKFLTMPFVKIFSYLYKDPEQEEVVGRVCTVLLPANSERMGQAVIRSRGNTLMLNVKTSDGEFLAKGKNAVVLEFKKDKNYYVVQQVEA